jgi:hypothetical protein
MTAPTAQQKRCTTVTGHPHFRRRADLLAHAFLPSKENDPEKWAQQSATSFPDCACINYIDSSTPIYC